MKILLVNKFHYLKGGSETFYFALAEILKKAGHEVIYFAMQDEKNFECSESEFFVSNVDYNKKMGVIKKILNACKIFYSFEAKRNIKKLIEKEKPDIVHLGLIHKQITFSIIGVIKRYNIPIVYSVHDMILACPCYTMLSPQGTCQKCIDKGVISCIKKSCVKGSKVKSILAVLENRFIKFNNYYNKIDVYISECEFYKQVLSKANFTNSPIECITNFLPPSKSIELNIVNGEYFLYFGRFSREKGVLTLISGYKKSGLNIPLFIIGGGPEEGIVKDYVRKNNLSDRVNFLGYVYGSQMEEYIRNSKAIIVPSEWYENCPYSIIESMAKSKIVIASNIGGLPELIDDGVNGYMFESGNENALCGVLKRVSMLDDQEFERMSVLIYKKAKITFDGDIYLEKLMGIYKRQLNL
ncbi:glycosyltransferase [Clostridium sp.]|uniref:glycosyltransferase n=1 Tax=Clostridium sp. TaxID=1506 RepID=UPI001A53EAFF|nr:glycosyltransferase [Clostridium sp.]MBK5241013.1 glycosyltransferase [Clostridium sp.]